MKPCAYSEQEYSGTCVNTKCVANLGFRGKCNKGCIFDEHSCLGQEPQVKDDAEVLRLVSVSSSMGLELNQVEIKQKMLAFRKLLVLVSVDGKVAKALRCETCGRLKTVCTGGDKCSLIRKQLLVAVKHGVLKYCSKLENSPVILASATIAGLNWKSMPYAPNELLGISKMLFVNIRKTMET